MHKPIGSYNSLQSFLGFTDEVTLRHYNTTSVIVLSVGSYFLLASTFAGLDLDGAAWTMLGIWATIEFGRIARARHMRAKRLRQPWTPEARAIIEELRQMNADGSLEQRLHPQAAEFLDRYLQLHGQILHRLPNPIWTVHVRSQEDIRRAVYRLTEEVLRIVYAGLQADDTEERLPALIQIEACLQKLSRALTDSSVTDSDLRQHLQTLSNRPTPEQIHLQL